MSKCENCYHKKVCIKGASYQTATDCKLYVPAEDVAEVVKCKDCKYYKQGNLLAPNKFCFRLLHKGEHIGFNFSDDDFCSHGERKDGDINDKNQS